MKCQSFDTPAQAILVVHGIGRQQRFETLDRFTTGLRRQLRAESDDPIELTAADRAPFDFLVRLQGPTSIDVFESYASRSPFTCRGAAPRASGFARKTA